MQWTDLVGMAPDDPKRNDKVGLLLVTEAHLEYNAGLVISIGSQGRPSPITSHSNADVLAEELADYRSQLLAMARPPVKSEYRWKTPLTYSNYMGHVRQLHVQNILAYANDTSPAGV